MEYLIFFSCFVAGFTSGYFLLIYRFRPKPPPPPKAETKISISEAIKKSESFYGNDDGTPSYSRDKPKPS